MESNRNDILKLIAVITMTVDHIGALFFPQLTFLRMIGRLAFPIFAYQIALGFQKTSDKNRYIGRMLLWAIITIWPFYEFSMGITGNPMYQNVLFTFFFSLVVLRFLEKGQPILLVTCGILPIVILEQFGITLDYGLYGVGVVLVFYLLKDQALQMLGVFLVTLGYLFLRMVPRGVPVLAILTNIQLLSVFAVLLIHRNWKVRIRLPKYFFYAFYPVHMGILVLIHNMI